jgi:hypothetical protein
MIGFREALGVTGPPGTYALLSPDNSPPGIDAGVYYHFAPDLSITQVMFMGGIAVALFGVLGLAPVLRQPGLGLARAVAVILVACGVAASATAFALAGTATPDAVGGWDIPALHSAASDQPVPVTPDCTPGSGFQVCVHPAFGYYLPAVAAALDPVAAEIAGLPGAPVRAEEVASTSGGNEVRSGTSGNPAVFEFTANHVANMFGEFYGIPDSAAWHDAFQQGLLDPFLTGPSQQAGQLDPAQQAVEDALMTAAGSPPRQPFSQMNMNGKEDDPGTLAAVSAAVRRFAALPASARRGWLAAHLTALRAGTITPAQIP